MKPSISVLFFLWIICSASVVAQSNDFGILNFQLGYEFGAHGIEHHISQDGNLLEGLSQDAITSTANFNFNAGLTKWLSAGVALQYGNFVESPANPQNTGNSITNAYIELRGYIGNTDNFNWYFGGAFGISSLKLERIAYYPQQFTSQTITTTYHSPHLSAINGFNWYFSKYIGMNFNILFSTYNFKLEDYSIDGESQAMQNYESDINTIGLHLRIGLSAKLY